MLLSDAEEYRLLYTDEFGDDVGLDEVQLLDPPLDERVPALTYMLHSSDQYLSYQAVLILTAWGKDIGLKSLEELVDREDISSLGFSPNRITDEDNVYDELSYAVHLYGLSGGDSAKMLQVFKKLLLLYPKYFFESKLKHCLLKNEFIELLPAIENALNSALAHSRVYQASQLLPVIAKLDAEKGWLAIQKFIDLPESVPNPVFNVAEALKYCPFNESLRLLKKYSSNVITGIADEANKSLNFLLTK